MYYSWYPDWYNIWPYGRRSRDEPRPADHGRVTEHAAADQELVEVVAGALLDDPAVTHGQVDLQVQNGVVILDGNFETAEAVDAAVARVWAIPGVVDVCNALTVRRRRYGAQAR